MPVLLQGFTNITQVYCGIFHSIFLTKDQFGNEAIFSFGFNGLGQLGLNDTNDRSAPMKIIFVDKILQISTGQFFTLFLTQKNQVFSFGLNDVGK